MIQVISPFGALNYGKQAILMMMSLSEDMQKTKEEVV